MRTEALYLQDICEACDSISSFVKGIEKEAFLESDMIQSAIVNKIKIGIIGEAAARVSEQTRIEHPEVDWKALIGLRNIIVHQYFSLNLELLWIAATQRVQPLKEHVGSVLRFRFPEH